MSKTYNLVGGGNVERAVLAVTVTNGTPTSVTATKTGGNVSLVHDSTNDIWTGNVTPGTWTVTATDGTNSGSISVTVDDVKVYSRIVGMSELGGDYTKLEWISSTGAVIDTGYQPVSSCRVFTKLQPTAFAMFWSATKADSSRQYYICLDAQSNFTHYCNGSDANWDFITDCPIMNTSTVYTISTSGRSITMNGSTYTVTAGSAITSPLGVTMSTARRCKMWYFQMTAADATTLVRDMVPARRNSDSVVGMYDKVNGVFYGSANSSVFIAGPAA